MRRSVLLVGAALLVAAAPSPRRALDRDASRIGFRGVAGGRAFTGVFKRWEAQVALDPGDLAHARMRLSIEAASAFTGDPARDRALAAPLDAGRFPRITFESRRIVPDGAGSLRVEGELRMRGAVRETAWRFAATRAGRDLRLDGAPPFDLGGPGAPSLLTVRLLLRGSP